MRRSDAADREGDRRRDDCFFWRRSGVACTTRSPLPSSLSVARLAPSQLIHNDPDGQHPRTHAHTQRRNQRKSYGIDSRRARPTARANTPSGSKLSSGTLPDSSAHVGGSIDRSVSGRTSRLSPCRHWYVRTSWRAPLLHLLAPRSHGPRRDVERKRPVANLADHACKALFGHHDAAAGEPPGGTLCRVHQRATPRHVPDGQLAQARQASCQQLQRLRGHGASTKGQIKRLELFFFFRCVCVCVCVSFPA
jgi:hypothetical protein